ncbi:MAG: molybdopterin-dependent oxidoreductase, partial [Candidatus Wallbacteria bacterium]|nr:molybdopterin-dependent oxidoreductase [Candidatus Wallbacteria bacterium]
AIALALSIDPAEVRRRNLLRENDATATSQVLKESVAAVDTMEAAIKKSHYQDKVDQYSKHNSTCARYKKGIGVSTVFYGVGLGAGGKHLARSGAFMQLHTDGSLEVAVGHTEMGQGFKTVVAQMASTATGVPYDQIKILEIDTSRVPDSGPTVASRATFMSGNALLEAAGELKKRLIPVLGMKFPGTEPESLSWENGYVFPRSTPDQKVPLPDIARSACYGMQINLSVVGWYVAPPTSFDQDTGQGDAYFTYTYASNIAEVTVDTRTGVVNLDRLTACLDVGKAVNPQQVEGQIQGGALQGIGYALTEKIVHDSAGLMKTTGFSTYIIPTAMDAPPIDVVVLEKPHSRGPFGAKGFGELPLMGVAPAIASAVHNATGVAFRELPLIPELVLEKLEIQSASGDKHDQ